MVAAGGSGPSSTQFSSTFAPGRSSSVNACDRLFVHRALNVSFSCRSGVATKGSTTSASRKIILISEIRDERESFRRCNWHADRSWPHEQQLGSGDTLNQLFTKVGASKVHSSRLNSSSRGELGSVWTDACSEGGELGLTLDGVGVVGRARPSRSWYSNAVSLKVL